MDNGDFRVLVIEEMERLKETTDEEVEVWDAVISLFSKYEEPYLLYLKSDIEILNRLVNGQSAYSVATQLSISSKEVIDVAKMWGIVPLSTTLDFSPLDVYFEDMTPENMFFEINQMLSVPITHEICKTIIYNIERYLNLLQFLDDEEDKKRRNK